MTLIAADLYITQLFSGRQHIFMQSLCCPAMYGSHFVVAYFIIRSASCSFQ